MSCASHGSNWSCSDLESWFGSQASRICPPCVPARPAPQVLLPHRRLEMRQQWRHWPLTHTALPHHHPELHQQWGHWPLTHTALPHRRLQMRQWQRH